MEDSFSVRVDKVFGSLPPPPAAAAASSLSNSLWRLTGEEIERSVWNRNQGSPENDDEPKPYPLNPDGFYANKAAVSEIKTSYLLQELEDDLGEEEEEEEEDDDYDEEKGSSSGKLVKPDNYDDEAWDIRTSIGRDCTLDNEEEEDEYDKVATGRDEAIDNLYLRDITDYEADINSYNELANTCRDVNKDPRANHIAAKIRLKEDAETAKNLDHLCISLNNAPPTLDTQNDISKDDVILNSILKNRENQIDSKSKKRVWFVSGCKDDSGEVSGGTNILSMVTSLREEAQGRGETSFLPEDATAVPDYVRNPSKYKHYKFDSSTDTDEVSNQRAYADFLKSLKGPITMELQEDISFELPKSLTFTPKKKPGDDTSGINRNEFKQKQKDDFKESMYKKGFSMATAAGDEQESGICGMEEDEPESAADDRISSSRRPGRQYRTKNSVDSDEIIT